MTTLLRRIRARIAALWAPHPGRHAPDLPPPLTRHELESLDSTEDDDPEPPALTVLQGGGEPDAGEPDLVRPYMYTTAGRLAEANRRRHRLGRVLDGLRALPEEVAA